VGDRGLIDVGMDENDLTTGHTPGPQAVSSITRHYPDESLDYGRRWGYLVYVVLGGGFSLLPIDLPEGVRAFCPTVTALPHLLSRLSQIV
jgi:hypothetical protein